MKKNPKALGSSLPMCCVLLMEGSAVFDTTACNVMVDGSGRLSGFFHAVSATVMETGANLTQLSAGVLARVCVARLMLVKTLDSVWNIRLICGR